MADVALLDELAELLGADDAPQRQAERAAAARRRAEVEHARNVLGMASTTPGMFTAEALADRWAETGPDLTVAERAGADRTWTYGHVIVDEAQELSAMAWRAVMRRCPGRSMTIVGDLAQAGSAASTAEPGPRTWGQVLDPYVPGRWRLAELTVTYRTPEQIMDLAADVLTAAGSSLVAPRSVRASAWDPTAYQVPRIDGPALAPVVAAELDLLDGGRLAVIVAPAGPSPGLLAKALRQALPGVPVGTGSEALEAVVAVLDVDDVKGLEFDAVVLCEPADLLERGGGWGDLYVALTRPTQRLRVVHARPLPPALHRLARDQHRDPVPPGPGRTLAR